MNFIFNLKKSCPCQLGANIRLVKSHIGQQDYLTWTSSSKVIPLSKPSSRQYLPIWCGLSAPWNSALNLSSVILHSSVFRLPLIQILYFIPEKLCCHLSMTNTKVGKTHHRLRFLCYVLRISSYKNAEIKVHKIC